MLIGDEVRVLTTHDILGDRVDTDAIYKIESFDRTDNSVWVERADGEIVNGVNTWNVYRSHVEPAVINVASVREQLAVKMEQLYRIQQEIAQLEARLDGDADATT